MTTPHNIFDLTRNYVISCFNDDVQLRHFDRTVYWLKHLNPNAEEYLLVSAIGHDIARAFAPKDGSTKNKKGFLDKNYIKKHQEDGAKILGRFLKEQGCGRSFIKKVKNAISKHEVGGNADQNILKDADSLSFLENGHDLYKLLFKQRGKDDVNKKFNWMHSRITSPDAKNIAQKYYNEIMNKPIIAFDCDDVIVATGELLINYYNQLHGTNVQPNEFYSKDYENVWKSDSETVAHDLFEYLLTDEYADLAPMQGAIETLNKLKYKYDLYIVTGRPDFVEQSTNDWVNKFLPGVFQKVIFTNFFKISNSRGALRTKADVCKELGAEYLVDDHFHHIKNVTEQGITGLHFGDLPWERIHKLPDNAVKIDNWDQLKQYFDEI